MVASLTLEWSSKDLKIWEDRAVERAVLRALNMAGNDAIKELRVRSAEGVRDKKKIKLGQVNKALHIENPENRREIAYLVWRLDVSGKPIRIGEYPARKGSEGVSVEINTGKRVTIQSAFIATLKSGHKGVFVRELAGANAAKVTKKSKSGIGRAHRVGRLPIRELYTTKVTDVFNNAGFVPAVLGSAQRKFASSYARLLPLQLDKLKGP